MIFIIIGIAVVALIIFNIHAENKKRSGDYIMKKYKKTGEIDISEPSSRDKPSYGNENSDDIY
jgi:hypothetical protein